MIDRFRNARKNGEGKWLACCPAHADRSPSLSVAYRDGRWLLHCFAGCDTGDILAAVGLEMSDLFDEPKRHVTKGDTTWARAVVEMAKGQDLTADDLSTVKHAKEIMGCYGTFNGSITCADHARNVLDMAEIAEESGLTLSPAENTKRGQALAYLKRRIA